MPIPKLNSEQQCAISAQSYYKKDFQDHLLKALEAFYGKNDKGREQKIHFISSAYDKMYLDIQKAIKCLGSSNKIVNKKFIENLQDILQNYINKNEKRIKFRQSPNKSEYVGYIKDLLDATKGNLAIISDYLKMTQEDWNKIKTRDICCYAQALEGNLDKPAFQKAMGKAIKALEKKDKAEVKNESGDQFISKYAKFKNA